MKWFDAIIGGIFVGACICMIGYALVFGEVNAARAELRATCNPIAAGQVADYQGELDEYCGEQYSQFIKEK